MKLAQRLIGPFAAAALLVAFAPPATPETVRLDPGAALLSLVTDAASRAIRDSKWGFVGALQTSINENAERCGVTPVAWDGAFGRDTAEALRAVAACKGVALEGQSHLTERAYIQLTGQAPPTALERARALARTMEASDYDRLEWNVCVSFKGDRGSVLTWGPYGKTLGWGGEMLEALRRVDRAKLEAAFGEAGAQGLDELLALKPGRITETNKHRFPGARPLMERICRTPGQKAAWEQAFATLGADPAVRAIYDEEAFGDEAWFRTVVERLSDAWIEAGLTPSEVDLAFFLDRAIHMGWGAPRFRAVEQALAELKASVPADEFTNARARFAVADAVRPTARPEDRLARDVIFLVDAEQELRNAMAASPTWPRAWKTSWRLRANVSAADVGLSDSRPAPDWPADEPLASGGGATNERALFGP